MLYSKWTRRSECTTLQVSFSNSDWSDTTDTLLRKIFVLHLFSFSSLGDICNLKRASYCHTFAQRNFQLLVEVRAQRSPPILLDYAIEE